MRRSGNISNAGWNAFATFWGIAISFASAPILIHNLGTEQYGIFLLVGSFTGILAVMNFGLAEATLRYVAHYYGKGDMDGVSRVFSSTLSFYAVLGLGTTVAVFLGSHAIADFLSLPSGPDAASFWLVRISGLIFSLRVIGSAFGAVPAAVQRYDLSGKITIILNVVHSVGAIGIAMAGWGVLYLLLWELFISVSNLCCYVTLTRRLIPGLRLVPSISLQAVREIFGYSVFSFLTLVFLNFHRESGRLVLGNQAGPASVAYLGTPENVANRLYAVISSATETLVPRFSAIRDAREAAALVLKYTWAAIGAAVTVFIPLAVLMPDFLRLWISPEFAQRSTAVGQCIALSAIGGSTYLAIATFFRGSGRPGVVTLVMSIAGSTVFVGNLLLIPEYGVLGVGYAYLIGSTVWLLGLTVGWFRSFGACSLRGFLRSAFVPLLVGVVAFFLTRVVRGWYGELNWLGLVVLGVLFSALVLALLFLADHFTGSGYSADLLRRVLNSNKVSPVYRYFFSKLKRS